MSRSRKYTIEEFEKAVQESRSMRDMLIRLNLNATGGNYELARKRIKDLNLSTTHWKKQGWAKNVINPGNNARKIDDYLVLNGPFIKTYSLKKRLINEGYLENKCYICNLTTWQNKSISLQIDHINGNKNDNQLINLRILCPNCHSQTDTFAGKNKGKYS